MFSQFDFPGYTPEFCLPCFFKINYMLKAIKLTSLQRLLKSNAFLQKLNSVFSPDLRHTRFLLPRDIKITGYQELRTMYIYTLNNLCRTLLNFLYQ